MLSKRGTKLVHPAPVRCLDHRAGKLATGAATDVYLWDENNANYAVIPHAHRNTILGLSFLDSTRLATASADRSTKLWDIVTGNCIFIGSHDDIVNDITRLDRLWISCSDDGKTKAWDVRQKTPALVIDGKWSVVATTADEAGHSVYTGGVYPAIQCWDVRTGSPVAEFHKHQDVVTGLDFSTGELLSRSLDEEIYLWNAKSSMAQNQILRSFSGSKTQRSSGAPLKVAFGNINEVIAGTYDGRVVSWIEGSMSEQQTHKGAVYQVLRVGDSVYSAGADSAVVRW